MIIATVVFTVLAALGYSAWRFPAFRGMAIDWLRRDKKRAAVTAGAVLAGSILLGVLVDIFLPSIALVVFLGWCAYDYFKPASPAAPNCLMFVPSTYEALFLVLQECADSIRLRRPAVALNLSKFPPTVTKRGVQVIQAKVQRADSGPMEDEAKEAIQQVLQNNLNEFHAAGCFVNAPVSVSPDFPPWVIDEVLQEGAYIVLHIAIPDNKAVADYLTQRVFEMPAISHEPPVDEDFG